MSSRSFNLSDESAQRYLKRRVDDLSTCQDALTRARWETLETVGHRLKGSAPSFGFDELGELGTRLEIAAQEMNITLCTSLVAEFTQWVQAHQKAE